MKFKKVNGYILFLGIFSSLVCQSASGQEEISLGKDNLVCVREDDKDLKEKREKIKKIFIATGIFLILFPLMVYGGYKLSSYFGNKNEISFPDMDVEKAQSNSLEEQKMYREREKKFLPIDKSKIEEKKESALTVKDDKTEVNRDDKDLQKKIDSKKDSINTADSNKTGPAESEKDKDISKKTKKEDSDNLKLPEKEKIDKPNKEKESTKDGKEKGSTCSENKDRAPVYFGVYSDLVLYCISCLPVIKESGFPEGLYEFWHFRQGASVYDPLDEIYSKSGVEGVVVCVLKFLFFVAMLFCQIVNVIMVIFYVSYLVNEEEKFQIGKVLCHVISLISPTFSRLAAVVDAAKGRKKGKNKAMNILKGLVLGYNICSP